MIKKLFGRGDAEQLYQDGINRLDANMSKDAKADARAVKDLAEAMSQGHAGAEYEIGMLHYRGRHFEKNQELGLRFISNAAELGHQPASYRLGVLAIKSKRIEERLEGLKHLTKAAEDKPATKTKKAETGFLPAKQQLGILYFFDNDIKDRLDMLEIDIYKEGLKWLGQAATAGYEPSRNTLNDIADSFLKPPKNGKTISGSDEKFHAIGTRAKTLLKAAKTMDPIETEVVKKKGVLVEQRAAESTLD